MSDIGLNWGLGDWALIALIIGWPALVAGAALGLFWQRHRLAGALIGAVTGFAVFLIGFYAWVLRS